MERNEVQGGCIDTVDWNFRVIKEVPKMRLRAGTNYFNSLIGGVVVGVDEGCGVVEGGAKGEPPRLHCIQDQRRYAKDRT